MSEQSIGGDPTPFTKPQPTSVIDNLLDLDAFLSADVRRAEKTHRFSTRPDLEADIDTLDDELKSLVDQAGRPVAPAEASVGEDTRTAAVVTAELAAVKAEHAASVRSIRLRQMDPDDFQAWRTKWRDEIEKDFAEQPPEMWMELVSKSAVAPRVPIEKAPALRQQMGVPAFEALAVTAWRVNANNGVSVPKSPTFSLVQSQLVHEQS